jgi:hypothetical protein
VGEVRNVIDLHDEHEALHESGITGDDERESTDRAAGGTGTGAGAIRGGIPSGWARRSGHGTLFKRGSST